MTQGASVKIHRRGKVIDGDDTAVVGGAEALGLTSAEQCVVHAEAAERNSKHVKKWLEAEQREARESFYFR